jgi:hypothetical protein
MQGRLRTVDDALSRIGLNTDMRRTAAEADRWLGTAATPDEFNNTYNAYAARLGNIQARMAPHAGGQHWPLNPNPAPGDLGTALQPLYSGSDDGLATLKSMRRRAERGPMPQNLADDFTRRAEDVSRLVEAEMARKMPIPNDPAFRALRDEMAASGLGHRWTEAGVVDEAAQAALTGEAGRILPGQMPQSTDLQAWLTRVEGGGDVVPLNAVRTPAQFDAWLGAGAGPEAEALLNSSRRHAVVSDLLEALRRRAGSQGPPAYPPLPAYDPLLFAGTGLDDLIPM